MSFAIDFAKGIYNDCLIACQGTDAPEVQEQRVASIALRIIGVALIIGAAVLAAFGIAALATLSLGAIPFLVSAAVAFVFGHDLARYGCNKSEEINVIHNEYAEVMDVLRRIDRRIFMVGDEIYHGRSHALRGTWVLEPLFGACADASDIDN